MITLENIKAGDAVYYLEEYGRSNTRDVLQPCTVKSVGRSLIHTTVGSFYKDGLRVRDNCGNRHLVLNKEDHELQMEKKKLIRAIRETPYGLENDLTLEDLREVARLLKLKTEAR